VARLPDGIVQGEDGCGRCWWASQAPDYAAYHDLEWGRPVIDDHRLFEKLCLEGFQSGLSWLTILRKRDNFRAAFCEFDFARVAGFGKRDVARLMRDAGIVRHRGKIESVVNNARRALELGEEFGSLARFFWQYEPDPGSRPRRMTRRALLTLTSSAQSTAMSRDLKRRGFSFVGPTTAYAFMQAMGLVNDHLDGCHVRPLVEAARRRVRRPR
jgi:DNA-3-methyladenine glycosylase I